MTAEQSPAPKPVPKKGKGATLLCQWCGSHFLRPKASGPTPKWCGISCKQRAYEERVRQRELAAVHQRHQKQLDRVLGTLGAPSQAKVRAVLAEEPAEAGPKPQIKGQEALEW